MNKKILSSALLSSVFTAALPFIVSAQGGGPDTWFAAAEAAFTKIGASIVVIGWTIAGILWLVSAGSPEKIGTAKKAIVACVIGTLLIIIAAGAQLFIQMTFNI